MTEWSNTFYWVKTNEPVISVLTEEFSVVVEGSTSVC